MKKIYFYLLAFVVLFPIISNAQVYKFDFNPFTKISRIYTNNEIILEFDLFLGDSHSNNFKFEDGYIYELENNNWINKGFFNKDEIIYNKISYELKNNLINNVHIKKGTDKKWTKVKIKNNEILIDYKDHQFPKIVEYLLIQFNVRNIKLNELKALRNKQSTNINVDI